MTVWRGTNDDPTFSDADLIRQRTAWFDAYTAQRNVFARSADEPYTCPCCGHRTLVGRGSCDICAECGWEDDGQDDHDSSVVRGGPNGRESLDDARLRYRVGGGRPGEHRPPSEPR